MTLATTILVYIGYNDPVEAIGQALFVLVLVAAAVFFQKGGGWAALAASVIYICALLLIGPKSGSTYVAPAIILRITMYGFTGLGGGEICARMKQTLESIQEVDLVDHDTGLFNTEHFYRLAGNSLEAYERYHSPFSVILFHFDQDDFKKLDPTSRSQALWTVGREVKAAIRTSDESGRPSLNSIGIILFSTDAKNAKAVIKRVTEAFQRVFGKDAGISVDLWSTPDDIEKIRQYAHAR
jgi:GGDEF domain-containing protein